MLKPKISGAQNNPEITCVEPDLEWSSNDFGSWEKCAEVAWDDNV